MEGESRMLGLGSEGKGGTEETLAGGRRQRRIESVRVRDHV